MRVAFHSPTDPRVNPRLLRHKGEVNRDLGVDLNHSSDALIAINLQLQLLNLQPRPRINRKGKS